MIIKEQKLDALIAVEDEVEVRLDEELAKMKGKVLKSIDTEL